nr:MAG TPA: hypothetical protein [Bacteriophage sp.]
MALILILLKRQVFTQMDQLRIPPVVKTIPSI